MHNSSPFYLSVCYGNVRERNAIVDLSEDADQNI